MSGNRSWRISGLLQSLVRALGFTWLVGAAVVLFAVAAQGCGNAPRETRSVGDITQGLPRPIPPMPRTRDVTQSDIVDVISRLELRVHDLENDVRELRSRTVVVKPTIDKTFDDRMVIVTDGKYFRFGTPSDGWISPQNLETREEAEEAAAKFKESYFGSKNKARWKSAEGDFTVKAPCVSDCCRCAVCTCTETHCVENCGGREP